MKSLINLLYCSSLLLLSLVLASCVTESKTPKENPAVAKDSLESAETNRAALEAARSSSLPVKYQTATYLVDKQGGEDLAIKEEGKLKVEARITSTRGPQPLWDIMKRLAALKGLNISWASDVDQNVLVDVNISANDDFFVAIDNLLRQVDYYHELQGSTIIVKYKETRQFQIAMPFIKQTYKTKTGGDVLGGDSGGKGGGKSTNVAGEISLQSDGVAINQQKDGTPGGIEFNTWSSIENNLNSILNIWSTDGVESSAAKKAGQESSNTQATQATSNYDKKTKSASEKDTNVSEQLVTATFRRSTGGNTYFIDKPVGLITVTAPRPLLEKLEIYFKSLKKELYKQVVIEAKILEVQLDDSSSIGLDWNLLLRNLSVSAGSLTGGKTYSNTKTNTTDSANTLSNTNSVTNTNTTTNTTGATGPDNTFNYLLPDPLTASGGTSTFTGSNVASNIVSDVASAAATSGVSAATVLSQGVTGALGGAVSLAAFSFDSFLNAVSAQGQATILSNPKMSVMNGQPALLTVGRNVTYISAITSDVSDAGVITYSAETARALSGVGLALTANILDDKQIILNLVPVTSELVEPIEYRAVGLGTIGLPIINVREMSTTVKVNNGEMLVIGGLISSVTSDDGTFVPGTSSLGFFKYLFGKETKLAKKRELIILLKPRII
jgi:general secretion pathway protein D/MSHA biogenesis protein MshL